MSRLKTIAVNSGYVAVGAIGSVAISSKLVAYGLLCICAGAWLAQHQNSKPKTRETGEPQCHTPDNDTTRNPP